MGCLIKIPRRYLICLSLSVVFSFCLSVFGFVSDSYATSGTCTWTINKDSDTNTYREYIDTICPGFSYSSIGGYAFIRVKSIDLNFTVFPTNTLFAVSKGTSSDLLMSRQISIDNQQPNFSVSYPDMFALWSNANISGSSHYYVYLYFSGSNSQYSARYTGSVVFEYTDNLADFGSGTTVCPEPEEPQPCPPIPENPYDDKLDEIKKAIYCASAVMIMIYFFFIVYKIIVKDGGRR